VAEQLNRFECLKYLTDKITDALAVCWTGFYDVPNLMKDRGNYCYFSSLGCTVALGVGLALALPNRKIIAFTSDGDMLMELGSLPTLARENPKNLAVFVNDNETYQTVGGYPTMTAGKTDLALMAQGAGVEYAVTVRRFGDFQKEADAALAQNTGARLIVMKTEAAAFKEIPETTERVESKYRFIKYVEQTEGVRIFSGPVQDRHLSKK
jgi:thiamine pyrophosphate-dependent acetolactate synthase large subunit-like protein